jgi:hypothetical protein
LREVARVVLVPPRVLLRKMAADPPVSVMLLTF